MALLFCDSFDHYTTLLNKWDAAVASNGILAAPTVAIGASAGRSSAGLTLNGVTSANDTTTAYVAKNISPGTTTLVVGFAAKLNLATNGFNAIVLQLMDGATEQTSLRVTPSGTFLFARNGTTLGTQSSNVISNNTYHYIEVKITTHGSTGACELKVDGVSAAWITLTGQNTSATGTTAVNQIRFCNTNSTSNQVNTGNVSIDDIYVCDTSGSTLNTYLGDVAVRCLLPTGNGTTDQYTLNVVTWVLSTATPVGTTILDSNSNLQRCTANTGDTLTGAGAHPTWATSVGVTTSDNHVTWTCLGAESDFKIINGSIPDEDNSYLSDATVSDQSRFTYPATTGVTAKAVAVWMRARKDDAGVRSIRASTLSGGTGDDSGTDLTLSTNYAYYLGVLPTDPNTSATWTIAAVNAAEFGIKTTA